MALHGESSGQLNVHIPYAFEFADAMDRAAGTGYTLIPDDVGKFARQLDDDSIWMLTADSPITWIAVGASAGGAPATSKYVVTEVDAGLANAIVIPGLAGSPDLEGSGGAGTSEEYDTTTTGLTWNITPDVVDSNTTRLSHLYVQDNGGVELLGTKAWVPGSGAFDARCRLGIASSSATSSFGLLIMDSGDTNRLALIVFGGTLQAFSYAGSYSSQSSITTCVFNDLVLRITRGSSNDINMYWSRDGYSWRLIASFSFTFTVAKLGFRLTPASVVSEAYADWLRTDV
jgi:hypothetical protein